MSPPTKEVTEPKPLTIPRLGSEIISNKAI